MTVSWDDVRLDEAELSLLGVLVDRLNYVGRSESWVDGRVLGETDPSLDTNCFPETTRRTPGSGWERVSLLAPTSAAEFTAWRAERVDRALADLPLPDRRKPSKTLLRKRERAEKPYPADLLDCLQRDTTWWRSHGWSQPPGSRRVFYWRHADAIAVGTVKAKRSTPPERRVGAILLSLTNASRNDHALPPVTRTLPQAEVLHRTLVGIASRHGAPPLEIIGRDENGSPLRGPHEHAHINPLDLDGDGHLDHILVWAPMGLGIKAQAAVRAARKTFAKGDIDPLRLAPAMTGSLCDLVRLPGRYGRCLSRITGRASVWQSVTPFVPPRYLKAHGKNALKGQIRAELRSRGLPEPSAVHQLAPRRSRSDIARTSGTMTRRDEKSWIRFRHFKLARGRGPGLPIACGFAIRLEFEHPVHGPLALGYGSHFGLGLFERSAGT